MVIYLGLPMKNAPYIRTSLELKRLGQHIHVARTRRKLTVSALAIKSSVSRQVLTRIEQGDPNVGIFKIFNVLEALGLLQGISSWADPEHDHAQALKEIKEWRESSAKKKKPNTKKNPIFSDEKLNF
jgi:transcriptional regulator with XRE-family HTH domain